MYINFNKLNKAGFDVRPVEDVQGNIKAVEILSKQPIHFDWRTMEEQFDNISLPVDEIETALIQFSIDIQHRQIMKAI